MWEYVNLCFKADTFPFYVTIIFMTMLKVDEALHVGSEFGD